MTQTIIFKDYNPELFNITTYPDGQRSVDLCRDKIDVKKPVTIKCRIKNFGDLEILLCLVAALRKYDYYLQEIQFIYLFGMRSDRSFTGNDCNYFRDVVAPIINGMKIPKIRVFAPHNPIILNYINATIYNIGYFHDELNGKFIMFGDENGKFIKSSILLSNDQNSCVLGHFNKKRIGSKFVIKFSDNFKKPIIDFPIMIMDDLCDAGGTFIAEAEFMKNEEVANKKILCVAHGLFTKGIEPILQHFNRIIMTNSYQDIIHPQVTIIEVI